MAATKELFSKKILSIKGVKGFILARDDGVVLAHRVSAMQPDTVASMMVLCGMDCYKIKNTMGFSHFNHLMFTLHNNDNLLVFPVKNYFLGVVSAKDKFNFQFILRIRRFIDTVTGPSQ